MGAAATSDASERVDGGAGVGFGTSAAAFGGLPDARGPSARVRDSRFFGVVNPSKERKSACATELSEGGAGTRPSFPAGSRSARDAAGTDAETASRRRFAMRRMRDPTAGRNVRLSSGRPLVEAPGRGAARVLAGRRSGVTKSGASTCSRSAARRTSQSRWDTSSGAPCRVETRKRCTRPGGSERNPAEDARIASTAGSGKCASWATESGPDGAWLRVSAVHTDLVVHAEPASASKMEESLVRAGGGTSADADGTTRSAAESCSPAGTPRRRSGRDASTALCCTASSTNSAGRLSGSAGPGTRAVRGICTRASRSNPSDSSERPGSKSERSASVLTRGALCSFTSCGATPPAPIPADFVEVARGRT